MSEVDELRKTSSRSKSKKRRKQKKSSTNTSSSTDPEQHVKQRKRRSHHSANTNSDSSSGAAPDAATATHEPLLGQDTDEVFEEEFHTFHQPGSTFSFRAKTNEPLRESAPVPTITTLSPDDHPTRKSRPYHATASDTISRKNSSEREHCRGAHAETDDSAFNRKVSHASPSITSSTTTSTSTTSTSTTSTSRIGAIHVPAAAAAAAAADTNPSNTKGKSLSFSSTRPGAVAETNDSSVRQKLTHVRPGALPETDDSAVREKLSYAAPSTQITCPGAVPETNDSKTKGKITLAGPSKPTIRPGVIAETNDAAVKRKVSSQSASIRPGAVSETNDAMAQNKTGNSSRGVRPGAISQTNDFAGTEKSEAHRTSGNISGSARLRSRSSQVEDSATSGTIITGRPRRRGGSGANTELLETECDEDALSPPTLGVATSSSTRSDDTNPDMFDTAQSSNVVMDDTNLSVVTEITDHSVVTLLVRNQTHDDQSVTTSHSMLTANVRNTLAVRFFQGTTMQRTSTVSAMSGNSTGSTARRITRRSSSTQSYGRPLRMLMDEQGHTMSSDEMRRVWEAAGKCIECGIVQTHNKVRYGPFGVLRRMEPKTEDGRSFKGYCLRCHDVHSLRRILNDPEIPFDLFRHDFLNSSHTSLGAIDEMMVHHERKRGPITTICLSTKVQICLGVFLVFLAGALVGVGITVSKQAEPFVPPEPTSAPSSLPSTSIPTAAPTSYEWVANAEIVEENIDSFGFSVELSAKGTILAVSAPAYNGSKGLVSVYQVVGTGASQKWLLVGDPLQGSNLGGQFGFGMALSNDGSTIAVGAPGYMEGLVEVFSIDPRAGLTQVGQTIIGPGADSQFGYTLALSGNGDRLFVGAPQYAVNNAVYGLVIAYDFNGNQWVQVGDDIMATRTDTQFGSVISTPDTGEKVVVGAPLDDEKWTDAGQVFMFALQGSEWVIETSDSLTGPEEGSMLGAKLAINALGMIVITSGSDSTVERFADAGVVTAYGIDLTFLDYNSIGLPIVGNQPRAGLGNDMDIGDTGETIILAGTNGNGIAGYVHVYNLNRGQYVDLGREFFAPTLGNGVMLSKGPSVALASSYFRVVVGYESVMGDNGNSHSLVRIFDFTIGTDFDDQAPP